MNNIGYRCALRKLIIVLISSSALMIFSMAVADGARSLEENEENEDNRLGLIGIEVSGASAGITTDYFEEAVTEAIIASGLFSGIDDSGKTEVIMRMLRVDGTFSSNTISDLTPYFLKIRVVKVDTPSFSMRMTVSMNAIWILYRTADNAELLHENIPSSYTGGVFEGGMHGANRVRVAMQGAARESVRIGMGMIESLDFTQGESQSEQPGSESSVTSEQIPEAVIE